MRATVYMIALAATALLSLGGVTRGGASQSSLEYEVKAAFLYNFAKFVEWPATAFAAADAPLVFCVVGRSPFEDKLERVVSDRTANGRRIAVREDVSEAEASACHLAFMPETEDERVARIVQTLQSAQGTSVLTVGETDRFAESGGMIRLVVEEGRVRFDINAAATERAGLKVSSQLLKLGRRVER